MKKIFKILILLIGFYLLLDLIDLLFGTHILYPIKQSLDVFKCQLRNDAPYNCLINL